MNHRTQLLFPILSLLFFFVGFVACNRSSSPGDAEEIPEAFAQLCASCHGTDLKGNIAQSLLDGSWQFGSRSADIFRAIKFGNPQAGLPSWKAVL